MRIVAQIKKVIRSIMKKPSQLMKWLRLYALKCRRGYEMPYRS